MYRAQLRIELCGRQVTEALCRSLKAEAKAPVDRERSAVSVECNEHEILILITAKSLSTLRAILNTYLYLIHAASSVLEELSGGLRDI